MRALGGMVTKMHSATAWPCAAAEKSVEEVCSDAAFHAPGTVEWICSLSSSLNTTLALGCSLGIFYPVGRSFFWGNHSHIRWCCIRDFGASLCRIAKVQLSFLHIFALQIITSWKQKAELDPKKSLLLSFTGTFKILQHQKAFLAQL